MGSLYLSQKMPIGILNEGFFQPNLDASVRLIRDTPGVREWVHIVDDNVWPGTGEEIEARLLEEKMVISDHHGGFARSNPHLTAVSTTLARERERRELGLTPENTTVLTTVKNVDEDGIDGLAVVLGYVPAQLRGQVEATSIFTDCTMFGGKAFKPGYKLTETAEIAGLAINQLLYQASVEHLPAQAKGMKCFPFPFAEGITEAVGRIYEQVISEALKVHESVAREGAGSEFFAKAQQYLARVQAVYEQAAARGVELIPRTLLYLDMTKEPLDKTGPVAFWLAEGNGQFVESAEGKIMPLALREAPTGYTLASADPRRTNTDPLPYDLLTTQAGLKALSKGWDGKSTVLLGGARTPEATPEQVAAVVREAYHL